MTSGTNNLIDEIDASVKELARLGGVSSSGLWHLVMPDALGL